MTTVIQRRRTDRQTDGHTDRQQYVALHYMHRAVKDKINTAIAVQLHYLISAQN